MEKGDGEQESAEERQDNEVQLLEAIYGDAVVDTRKKDVWKVWRPVELRIALQPQESMGTNEVHASVEFHVRCSSTYPDKVPVINIENQKGISNQQKETLLNELGSIAKAHIGEVMILELCQHVQTFLHVHNMPPSKSFYEEMMWNQKKKEEKLAKEEEKKIELLRKKEEKELQQIEEVIQKRKDALKEDAKKKREMAKRDGMERSQSLSEPSTPPGDTFPKMTPINKDTEQRHRSATSPEPRTPRMQNFISESGSYHKPERRRRTSTPLSGSSESHESDMGDHECKTHPGTTILAFNTKRERTVHRGKCLGHSPRGSSVFAGMDTSSGELVAVDEWVLKWRHAKRKLNLEEKEIDEKESSKCMKQVHLLEAEMLTLMRLSHKHLVHYHSVKCVQEPGCITVYVLKEYAGGGSLNHYLKTRCPLPMDIMRHYTIQILAALSYLHNKSLVHKDFRATSVMLDQTGKVRLGDYSLVKRLSDLVAEIDLQKPGVKFDDHQPPTLGRGGKKGDIYRLGVVLLSLAQGCPTTDTIPVVPTTLPQDFQDFVTKCLIKDEHHRWSSHELQEHSFVCTPVHRPIMASPPGTHPDHQHDQNSSDEEEPGRLKEGYLLIPFIPASDSGSRLQNEFDILKWLGKGGFGDVIKVRNKLDGRYYAIKRIPLNPNKKSFTKKITREVKLLSRLNHENVVRYYNSWIETSNELPPNDSSFTDTRSTSPGRSASPSTSNFFKEPIVCQMQNEHKMNAMNSLGFPDHIETDAPGLAGDTVDWSISVDFTRNSVREASTSSSSSEDEEEEEEDVFGAVVSFMADDSDSEDGIVFQHDNFDEEDTPLAKSVLKTTLPINQTEKQMDSSEVTIHKLQFLYIQMEFCEKSTLRNCIDAGLYQDVNRVWRLFREMVEGLVHIHQQGMIHRDLKPVNIFLDSNDHVKIGDFGLATTDIITRQQTSLMDLSLNPSINMDPRVNMSRSDSIGDDSHHTGKVGTALYVSPEMMSTAKHAHYNQKVDIYSLGVMFFEMCYRPLETGMERVQILTSLRQPSIDLPDDFNEVDMYNQVIIVKWLLNHDPSQRPTSHELLHSDHLPPPQMEEAELNEVLRSAIANPDSKSYKHMLEAIFHQPVHPAMDFSYDSQFDKTVGQFSKQHVLAHQHVSDTLVRLFSRHGALHVPTPMLMPRSALYKSSDSYVCLMDHSGGIVALPYDLRVPFARYLARNNVTNLKRYSIEKVFRENRIHWLHPKELTACSFDIVTPTHATLVPDAEVVSVVFEVISEFPALQNRNYFLRLNHVSLLHAVLLHCGVPEHRHQEVYTILADSRTERQRKMQIQTRLYSLSLSDNAVSLLFNFVEKEGPFSQMISMLRCITKTRGMAGSLAKKGIHEMEAIINHIESLGHKLEPVLALGLVYDIQHFSGAIFEVRANVRRKKKLVHEVLAAGGRYDNLISKFKRPGITETKLHCAVGISLAFDRIVTSVMEEDSLSNVCPYDVLVCSVGHKHFLKEKLSVLRLLWAAGISAEIYHDACTDLEDIQDFCRQHSVCHLVILKDLESGSVKLRSFEKEGKVIEKKVNLVEIGEYLQRLQAVKSESIEPNTATASKGQNVVSQSSTESCGSGKEGWNAASTGTNSNLPPFNISFITQDNSKLAKNTKRNYESQIFSILSVALASISTKCHVEIFGLELTSAVLKTVAANLELSKDESTFNASISSIVEKHPRHRKYLSKITDAIYDLKFNKNCQVIMLYGWKDDSFKLLL